MALVAAAVANGGQMMKPYLVAQVLNRDRTVLCDDQARALVGGPCRATTAATVRDLMVEVVKSGTGTRAALDGVQVAGKTGTAEVADAESHAWFAGFAPADDPQGGGGRDRRERGHRGGASPRRSRARSSPRLSGDWVSELRVR